MLVAAHTTGDSRLDSADDSDDADGSDKTELYQVSTDQFTGDTTKAATSTEGATEQDPKDSRDRVDTSAMSDEVEPIPSLEPFIPQRISTPKPSAISSHTSLVEPILGPSFASDQTDFSAHLPPEMLQCLESNSSDSPDSHTSLTMASRSLIELQTLGDALQSWDEMREHEKAERPCAPSGVVTRAAAAKAVSQQPYFKKDTRGIKHPKKASGS